MKTHYWIALLVLAAAPLRAADFEILNEAEFKKIVAPDAKMVRLAGDIQFAEGTQWVPADGGYLVFSDIPGDELRKWSAAKGVTSFRKPSQNANGNTLDREGRLLTCEHGGRRISILEKDGTLKTLVDAHDGKKLNSPNDAAVKTDGTVWFTDPEYGLAGRPREQAGNFVFRFDPKTKRVSPVVTDFDRPNGICFSPDEKRLYVADSGKPKHIRVFDVKPDNTLANGKIFCTINKGGPDGIRCDADGRIWSSAGDGVHIFGPDGNLIGKILTPQVPNPGKNGPPLVSEAPANLCFGGKDMKTLFIAARKSLYSIPVLANGVR
jgi:gluconolactonase